MKINLLFILLLCPLFSIGQQNELLVDTTKMWSTLWQSASGGPPPYYKSTSYLKFADDTLIGTIQYKKVYSSLDSIHSVWTATGYFIREDSLNKVYYRTLSDPTQILLYDFNAQVGDSLTVNNAPVMVVDSIDSVFMADKYRKRFFLSPGGEIWVEGIGSLCGLLCSGFSTILGGDYDLLCYYESGILKYSNPDFSACFYNNIGINEANPVAAKVNLYPNPVTSTSVFIIGNPLAGKNYTLELYSIMGAKIKTIPLNADGQALIFKSDFTVGLYLYRLTTSGLTVGTGKFLVE